MAASTGTAARWWVPTPPGWVEIAAFDTDARAERHWREMVEPARPHLGDGATDHLYVGLRSARAAVAGSGVTSAGVVLTEVDDEPAVWTFSTRVERVASGEVSPVALVERSVGTLGRLDDVADITLVDGRTAVRALLRLTARSPLAGRHVVAAPAAAPHDETDADGAPDDGAELGVCVVAVALPRRPRDLVLVTASSPVVAHGPLLAHVASAIAAGVHVGTEEPEGVARAHGVLAVDDADGAA